ncbi:MAG: hypothetical protein K2V38_18295, partial [Gemmataceae bacterium]|nr:hypothetical protein [Gemmataceae bacterium]
MPQEYARVCRRWLPALALAALVFHGRAEAAFTVTINGTLVATDNGAGDSDPAAGVISFDNYRIGGWTINFTGRTTFSTATAGSLQGSRLLVTRDADGTGTLVVAFQEDSLLVPNQVGPQTLSTTLTRNTIGALGTSGTVGLTSTATDRNGNTASVATANLTASPPAQGSGNPVTAPFNRQTPLYALGSTVTISGLAVGDGVQITTDALVVPAIAVPAPAGALLMLSGLP